eukprot:1189913-Prorocentrum_minimum.AAC.2
MNNKPCKEHPESGPKSSSTHPSHKRPWRAHCEKCPLSPLAGGPGDHLGVRGIHRPIQRCEAHEGGPPRGGQLRHALLRGGTWLGRVGGRDRGAGRGGVQSGRRRSQDCPRAQGNNNWSLPSK